MKKPLPACPVTTGFGQLVLFGIGLVLSGFLTGCAAVNTPDACRLDHVADVPIRFLNGLPVVTVEVGGKPLRMILDTGAEGVVVTPGAAERLGLDRDFQRYGVGTGLGAQASYWPTKPVAVHLGPVASAPTALAVGVIPTVRGSDAPEGLLGGAVLSAYDLDIDIAQRRLGLYRLRRCPSGPAPLAGPSFSVRTSRIGAMRMAVPVSLDGRAVPMLVDTGANRSLVDAAAVGVADGDAQADRAVHVNTADPVGLDVRLHTFKTLQLGSDVVENPLLATGRVDKPGYSGLLGTDYWRRRRLWLSYGSGVVFVGLPAPR